MIPFKLDYAADKTFNSHPVAFQSLLETYTGNRISAREAKLLSRKIADHKWYVSERLNRDVGFHVAAIDFVENFYEPDVVRSVGKTAQFSKFALELLRSALKTYLTAKGNTLPL